MKVTFLFCEIMGPKKQDAKKGGAGGGAKAGKGKGGGASGGRDEKEKKATKETKGGNAVKVC